MKLLLATHNLAKFARYKKIVSEIRGLEIVSLTDLNITKKVEENFLTSQENAEFKARSYAKLSGLPTLAVDEAVQTNFLPDNEQPGVYARRMGEGRTELDDEDLLNVWIEAFKKYPQDDKQFIWDFSLAYYDPLKNLLGISVIEEISHVAKYISQKRNPGYPLSSALSIERMGVPHIELSSDIKFEIDKKAFESFLSDFEKWKDEVEK